MVPPPLVLPGPARHGQPRVGRRADRHLAPGQVADVAMNVGEQEVVARVHPLPHRLVDLVRRRGLEHGKGRLGHRVGLRGRRVSERQAVARLRSSLDDRAVIRDRHVYLGRVAVPHRDRLAPDVRLPPSSLGLVPGRAVTSKTLHEEVLVVGACVRHAPGDVSVVSEVREARIAGERQPYDIELGTRDVVLVVDVGDVKRPVRVARQEGLARGGPAARQRPAIAP